MTFSHAAQIAQKIIDERGRLLAYDPITQNDTSSR
jgi:hypothetical protein